MTEIEKVGIVALFQVKTRGRKHYITLDPKAVESYDIKHGDILKVEILEVRRKPREEEGMLLKGGR
jgi:hypothetical protein